jgi:hypothetical protein
MRYLTMRTTTLMGLTVLGLMLLAHAGCQTAAPGVEDQMGTLETVIEALPPDVMRAAGQAMEDLQLTVVSSKTSGLDGSLIARTAQDKKVSIHVEKLSDTASQLRIRVGAFGDQDLALTILNKLKAKL